MNSVKTIIDEWYPIDLLAYAPEDEYDFEIKEIEQILALQIDVDQLAVEIFRVFTEAFGTEVFKKSLEECRNIAGKILGKT